MAIEVSTLGSLSKLFDNLATTTEKKNIAKHFGLGHPRILESWMKNFSFIRNICAHHSRLWNRGMTIQPILLNRPIDRWISPKQPIATKKIFASLCCMRYFLNRISPNNHFSQKLQDLLTEFPGTDLQAIGFYPGWEKDQLWQ